MILDIKNAKVKGRQGRRGNWEPEKTTHKCQKEEESMKEGEEKNKRKVKEKGQRRGKLKRLRGGREKKKKKNETKMKAKGTEGKKGAKEIRRNFNREEK